MKHHGAGTGWQQPALFADSDLEGRGESSISELPYTWLSLSEVLIHLTLAFLEASALFF